MEAQYSHIPDPAAELLPDHLALLLEGCRRHDRLSQEKLYMHFFDKMLAAVKRTFPDQDAAMSILNNGFLRAFTKISQYNGSGSFEGWLRKIIHHAAADYYREHKTQLESATSLPMHLPLVDAHDPSAYKELLQLLQYLPPATRMVINLFIIEGYSHKEIGVMLGISVGTSKWHVSEGKQLLKKLLKQQHEGKST